AQSANLAAASTGLMFQTEPVLLDLEELLINRQNDGGPPRAGSSEMTLGVCQKFLVVPRHGSTLRLVTLPSNEPLSAARSHGASSCCRAWAAESRATARLSFCCRDNEQALAESCSARSRRDPVRHGRDDCFDRRFAAQPAAALLPAIL